MSVFHHTKRYWFTSRQKGSVFSLGPLLWSGIRNIKVSLGYYFQVTPSKVHVSDSLNPGSKYPTDTHFWHGFWRYPRDSFFSDVSRAFSSHSLIILLLLTFSVGMIPELIPLPRSRLKFWRGARTYGLKIWEMSIVLSMLYLGWFSSCASDK